MTVPVPLDAYGEDGDFNYYNGSIGDFNYGGFSGVAIALPTDETFGKNLFRPANAREAVCISGNNTAISPGSFGVGTFMTRFWPFAGAGLASGWCSHRVWCQTPEVAFSIAMYGIVTSGNEPLIYIVGNPEGNPGAPFDVYGHKGGAMMLLGTTLAGFSGDPEIPDKLDINFDFVAGFVQIFVNGFQVFDYTSGLTSTDRAQGTYHAGVSSTTYTAWSENFVCATDTRDMQMYTLAPNALGTLDQWTGALVNIDTPVVTDGAFDTTTTSGYVQRYKFSAIPTGNYIITGKFTNIRATQGAGSLTHLQAEQVVNGGHVEDSATQIVPTAFGPMQYIDLTNPYTGVLWTQADINDPTRENGYKALT